MATEEFDPWAEIEQSHNHSPIVSPIAPQAQVSNVVLTHENYVQNNFVPSRPADCFSNIAPSLSEMRAIRSYQFFLAGAVLKACPKDVTYGDVDA